MHLPAVSDFVLARRERMPELGKALSMFLLGASLFTATWMAKLDLGSLDRLQRLHALETEIPLRGSLSGRNALTDKEWSAAIKDRAKYVVIFPLSPGAQGAQFWRDVAERSLAETPDVEFAGVCAAGTCPSSSSDWKDIHLLTSLDPYQMRTLAVANDQNRALLYHGAWLLEALQIGNDAASLARKISVKVHQSTKAANEQSTKDD